MVKLSQEEVEKFFKNNGWNVKSNYKGNHEHIVIEKDGYFSETTLANFKKNQNCIIFGSKNPFYKENIKLFIYRKNPFIKFIDAKPINGTKPRIVITMQCECGKIFQKTWEHIYDCKELCCSNCSKKIQNSKMSDVRTKKWIKQLSDKGFTIMEESKKIIANSKLDIQDSAGYRYYANIKNAITTNKLLKISPQNNLKYLLYNLNILRKEYNLSSIPMKYIGDYKIILKCSCGNIYEKNLYKWLDGQDSCENCNKTESSYERAFKIFMNDVELNFKQEFVINTCRDILPLPFDFWIKKYNVLVEIDGQQHKHPVQFGNMTKEESIIAFNLLKKHDEIKTNYCLQYYIPLLRLSYKDFEDNTYKEKFLQFIKPFENNELK